MTTDRPQNRHLKPRHTPAAKLESEWYPRPISLRVGKTVGEFVFGMEQADRITWLRQVLHQAVQDELNKDSNKSD
jgi:hypothetical protein